jgi:hypothetical protein
MGSPKPISKGQGERVFFVMMTARALRQGELQTPEEADA